MYQFGWDVPQHQNPNQHQSPHPSHQSNNAPFGAGCWVESNHQQAQVHHQQQQQQQYQSRPNFSYSTNNSNNAPYPSSKSKQSYSSSQQSYTFFQPPYPISSNPHQQYESPTTPYPHNNQYGYQQQQQQGNMPIPPFGAAFYTSGGPQPHSEINYGQSYPSSVSSSPYSNTNLISVSHTAYSSYPTQSNYPTLSSAPYPNQSLISCPYPATNTCQNRIVASNMAQCFTEIGHPISSTSSASASPSNNSYSSLRPKGTPTVVPAQNFDPIKDVHALRKAMKGFGTDEDALIEIICRRTNEQRQEIQRQYKTHFGKDLIEDIKSETSGNFEKLLVGLLRPIVDFYCIELCDAMKGIGTDEDVLIEILCTLSNSEIHTIKNQYLRMYGAHLESELKSETSGNFKRLLVSLCAAGRDESGRVDARVAQNDAKELFKAGELRVGTDESMFNMVLCQRNYQQLKLILNEYEGITGHSLKKAIKREFSGDIQEGLLAICKCVTNKAEYFASRLHKSMAGMGTNDRQLIRVIITRSEIDMQDIKVIFERIYGKSLKSWIKDDTSGHYKHALYALIGEQRSS